MANTRICRFDGGRDSIDMRNMLLEGYTLEKRPCNMFFYYFDNWRYGRDDDENYYRENSILWRKNDKLIAFSILDNEPLYSIQIHPDYYSELSGILEYLVKDRDIKQIAVYEHQQEIIDILVEFGFKDPKHSDNEYEYDLTENREEIPLPRGFLIKPAAELQDLGTIYRAKGSVFKGPHMTEEAVAMRMKMKLRAPSYSADRVFTVVDESTGECAAFAVVWLNEETGVVGFEPVGTVPDYRKRGLSKTLLTYIFLKYGSLGYKRASIRTGSDPSRPANYLYPSLNPINVYRVIEFSRD